MGVISEKVAATGKLTFAMSSVSWDRFFKCSVSCRFFGLPARFDCGVHRELSLSFWSCRVGGGEEEGEASEVFELLPCFTVWENFFIHISLFDFLSLCLVVVAVEEAVEEGWADSGGGGGRGYADGIWTDEGIIVC